MQRTLKQTVAPTNGPVVTTAEFKTHARIDNSEEDTLIDAYIETATQYVERVTGVQLLTATWTLTLDNFPLWQIEVYKPQFSSVTSIIYTDTAGDSQTVTAANYTSDVGSVPGRITPAYGVVWPTAQSIFNSVVVTFVAGYGAPSAVPERYKAAIKLLAADWFESRNSIAIGTIVAEIPRSVEQLLAFDKMLDFA